MKYEGTICDVQGIRVGHAQNAAAKTGVTVVICEPEGAVVSCDVRGAAPGTRETDLCSPENSVQRANAVALCGGSVFGLNAVAGIARWLEEHACGINMGECYVPIIPGAVIFDLAGRDTSVRPDAEMGWEASQNASKSTEQGNIGAGCGATVGKLIQGAVPAKGGVGSACIHLGNGITVGAIAVVNACGDIYDSEKLIACGREPDGTPIQIRDLIADGNPQNYSRIQSDKIGRNTTIAVVATDAVLTKTQAKRLATCAHDGFARAIQPVHTQMDGDSIFALATGKAEATANMIQLCDAAAEAMRRAIVNAIYAAGSMPNKQ